MSFENVNLWFAKDKNNEIMMIKDIIEENKHNEYTCPICGGLVRANTGTIKSWYFSHINADDCSSETIVHWFVKHELLKVGERFKVKINDDIEEYVCKEIIEEKEYNTKYGVYRPDLTVVTTTNEIIYIEVANTNGKKIKDFIDMWKELGNTVIEFKVGEVLNGNKIEVFNSIWYEGKEYYNQLKELREVCNKEKEKYEFTKDQVEQIDWLIDDICKYNNGLIEIDELSDEIQAIEYENQRQLVCNIVRNKKCGTVLEDYIEYNKNKLIKSNIKYFINFSIPKQIYDRVYGVYNFYYNNWYNAKEKISITLIDVLNLIKTKEKIDKISYIFDIRIDLCFTSNIAILKNEITNSSLKLNSNYTYCDYIENWIYEVYDKYIIYKLKNKIKRNINLIKMKILNKKGFSCWFESNFINNYIKVCKKDTKLYIEETFSYKDTITYIIKKMNEKITDEKIEMFIEKINNKNRIASRSWYNNKIDIDYIYFNDTIEYFSEKENEIYHEIKNKYTKYNIINERIINLQNYLQKYINFKKNTNSINLYINYDYIKERLYFELESKLETTSKKFSYSEKTLKIKNLFKKINNILNSNYSYYDEYKDKLYFKKMIKYFYHDINKDIVDIKEINVYKNDYESIKVEYGYDDSCIFKVYGSDINCAVKEVNNYYYTNKIRGYIDILNDRYKNFVYRKPSIQFYEDDRSAEIYIKCKNKNGVLYDKYIGYFSIYYFDSDFKYIEKESSNIIRRYIYRNKEDN